ncbi:MAG: hypothetical protein AB1758_35110, partial [Candidatus Eremiobacterota bacterium]
MRVAQVYYTSCERGLRGTRGFQVQAATPGLSPAVLEYVERLGVYVPPSSCPTRPTPEEVGRFPRSLRYHLLPGGEALVALSRYTGQDYSQRFGNYFTHTLVVSDPAEAFASVLPVELWGSPLWSTAESPSPELPPLELRPGSLDVDAFLRERREQAPRFLTAVEQALISKRRVILVDDAESVALWVAAACRVLPR